MKTCGFLKSSRAAHSCHRYSRPFRWNRRSPAQRQPSAQYTTSEKMVEIYHPAALPVDQASLFAVRLYDSKTSHAGFLYDGLYRGR
ncbi:unnamed protein product [Periconia digitata]|uniref:Uncharacterized protein n=1 Tax=Periconia digitata TaxID=1303443 RepID=A0A9W4U7B7_9PLEO|nr:unnamed protein product [Periconia digitata]